MKREELKQILINNGVPKVAFSLYGIKNYESLCLLEKEDGSWEIVYNDRGEIRKIATFYDEDYACQYIYNTFKESYGF